MAKLTYCNLFTTISSAVCVQDIDVALQEILGLVMIYKRNIIFYFPLTRYEYSNLCPVLLHIIALQR
jgi:hypothetical protein